jgi:hypothetical protein
VRRPFVTALFMTLVATRVLHPYAPAFVRDLVLLGTVGTLAGVLRTRAQRRVLAYALPFVVIDALRVLSHEASHWHRVTLLLASLAGCLPLVAVLRESRPLPTTASPALGSPRVPTRARTGCGAATPAGCAPWRWARCWSRSAPTPWATSPWRSC